jgi:predicted NAD/FAD-dependent oxidoreductase
LANPRREVRLASGIVVCGDHRDNASINGAMMSGRRAAEALLESRR